RLPSICMSPALHGSRLVKHRCGASLIPIFYQTPVAPRCIAGRHLHFTNGPSILP
ncbi:hypothetical protein HAX54_045179, partial [Datura stramonium]|nr:hypothetical protein [Datura stramonium]